MKQLIYGTMGTHFRVRRRLRAMQSKGRYAVLNLHRVAPADGSAYRPLEPSLFRALMSEISRRCRIATFEDVDSDRSDRPTVVLSFDDGYSDFVEYAMPIMAEFDIRSNINLIPECIESREPPFNVMVQDYLGKTSPEKLGQLLEGIGGLDTTLPPARLSAQIKFRPIAEQKGIRDLVHDRMLNTTGFQPTRMMSRRDVEEAARTHEIGAHSMEHASMEAGPDEYVRTDARQCREYFRTLLGEACDVYAFPNGSARPEQVEAVIAEGYSKALLVGGRFASFGDEVVPRFNFAARSVAEARFRLSGARASLRGD